MKWFIGALLLLVAALILQSGLLAYAMYVLLGLLLISRYLARRWTESLEAERSCDRSEARVGDEVTVVVTVRNAGGLPIPWVLLEDALSRQALAQKPPRIKVSGKRLKISLLRARKQTKLEYRLRFLMRGYYQIGPLVMETGDLFGLHRRYRIVTEPHFVLVYPRVVPLEGYAIASRRPIGEVRMAHRLYEDPTRIAGVRQYQIGDPLNRIHWRTTARSGILHSKIYEPSTVAGATILMDFHQGGYHRRGEPYRSELAITAAASLANAVYLMGQQVGLITNGRDAAERIRTEGWHEEFHTRLAARQTAATQETSDRLQPLIVETRRGVEQLQRILELLARLELTDGLSLSQLVIETGSRLPRDATVVALLSECSPETALALGTLRRQGFAVTAVLVVLDETPYEQAFGRLRSEGIMDIRHLQSDVMLASLCQQQVAIWESPYNLVTTV